MAGTHEVRYFSTLSRDHLDSDTPEVKQVLVLLGRVLGYCGEVFDMVKDRGITLPNNFSSDKLEIGRVQTIRARVPESNRVVHIRIQISGLDGSNTTEISVNNNFQQGFYIGLKSHIAGERLSEDKSEDFGIQVFFDDESGFERFEIPQLNRSGKIDPNLADLIEHMSSSCDTLATAIMAAEPPIRRVVSQN